MANAKIISFVAAQIAQSEVRAFAELDERLHPLQQAHDRLRGELTRLQQGGVATPLSDETKTHN